MNIPGIVKEGYRGLHYRSEGLKFFIKHCEIEIAINAKEGHKKGLEKWIRRRKGFCRQLCHIENSYLKAYKITDYVCPKYEAAVDRGDRVNLEELIETAYKNVAKVAP